MKRKYMIVSSFFIAILFLGVLCYGSYQYSEKISEQKTKQPESEQTGQSSEQKVNQNTKYILELYNENSQQLVTQEHTLPTEYIGMNRKKMEEYLEQCVKTMKVEEETDGLVDMSLQTFSPEKIVIRKTYHEMEQKSGFFLKLTKGEVVIYDRTGEVVYENTGIREEDVPKEERARLKKGYVVENEKDLYSILENFSS